ncbi:GNAT family N-acetyltransferase [Solibacillus sp. FSL R7-0682]|uniref:GNAT family N-acetyltransferase n=1 Tax=Solibacillus sp. FSL R7-0682 TaxID=2921690 RepID=UPI0030FBFADF
MLTIRQIFQKDYPQGKIVSYKYTSNKYYDVSIKKTETSWQISLEEEKLANPFEKLLEEEIFEDYKNGSEYYIGEWNGQEIAVLVIQQMAWNNTLLIHDLYVTESFKRNGIGEKLMVVAKKRGSALGVRSITLETQTSNYPAIQFYLKNGFELVGVNTISYTNEDMENKEVRIELAYVY